MSRSCFLCCINNRPKNSKNTDLVMLRGDAVDTVELATGMSVHERKLIKETGEIIFNKMHLENKGVTFLIAFFKVYPHHQRFFKAFRGIPPDELKSLPHLENHGRRVMDQMAVLVQHLEEPSLIKEQLSDLVGRHRPRRVKPKQMKDMLTMFVDFASQQLGSKFSPLHEAAWKKMISYVLTVLEEASHRMNGADMLALDNGSVPNNTLERYNSEANDEDDMDSYTANPDGGSNTDVNDVTKEDANIDLTVVGVEDVAMATEEERGVEKSS